jgi:hypothetical protein
MQLYDEGQFDYVIYDENRDEDVEIFVDWDFRYDKGDRFTPAYGSIGIKAYWNSNHEEYKLTLDQISDLEDYIIRENNIRDYRA